MQKLYFAFSLLAPVLCAQSYPTAADAQKLLEQREAKRPARRDTLVAQAVLKGADGSGVVGVVRFRQRREGIPTNVEVEAVIFGLKPGARHGMHIHEIGSCSNVSPTGAAPAAFLGAGGHFDPGPNSNSNPDANHPFHMGDVPNVEVDEGGIGHLSHITSRVSLSPGPLSLFDADNPATPFDDSGSAVILHAGEDQGTTGVAGGSGGARLACGVIEMIPAP